VQLQELLESTMTQEAFQAVKSPFFMAYYYQDDVHQDRVVSISAMLEMFDQLSTPENLKKKIAFPNAGDHVLNSPRKSQSADEVREETFRFAEDVLGLQPI